MTQDSQLYRRLDCAHYIHPFTDSKELGDRARVIVRAQGSRLWDSDGNEILDGMSGLWCVNIGYGRTEIADAVSRQMRELPYYNSFFQCANPPAILLAAELAKIAPPGFNHVFFAGSGSEANDTVIRMLRHYWLVRGHPKRTVIVSRRNAYHGSTMGGASLGGMAAMHAQGGLPIPDIAHIGQPYWFDEGREMSPDDFGLKVARELEDKIAELGAERIAGFIAEPIQGAGGVIVPPDSYWPEVGRICDAHGIPLIADEVICGFGRLGKWFGTDYYGLRPKLMPIAKGMTSGYLPMGGVLVHDDIAEVLREKGGEFAHGFTYGGHPACAAAGLENLRILREEKIVERAGAELAPYFQEKWRRLGEHPIVGEARGVGLVGALELTADKASGRRFEGGGRAGGICRDFSVEACGLVMRAVRDTMVVAPPLVMTLAEVDEMCEKAWKALDLTRKELEK